MCGQVVARAGCKAGSLSPLTRGRVTARLSLLGRVCGRVVVTARARVGVVVRSSFVRAVRTRCHRSGGGVVAGSSLLRARVWAVRSSS